MNKKKFFSLTCVLGIVSCFSRVNCCCALGWNLLPKSFPPVCPLSSTTTNVEKDFFETHCVESTKDEDLIPPELVSECLRSGRELCRAAKKRGNQLVRIGINLEPYVLSMFHFFNSNVPDDLQKASDRSNELLTATKLLQINLCSESDVTPNTFMSFLENQVIHVNDPGFCVRPSISCPKSKYRSIDGSCNNLEHPQWGQRGAPFTRIAAPRYADGIYAMPVAKNGGPLPNPRVISTQLFKDRTVPSRVMTYLNMQWGQLVTHDLLFQNTPATDEGGIQCCIGNGLDVLPAELLHDKCIPISIPDDDPFYKHHGVKCMNFVRSITTTKDDCSLGPAQQTNTVTSFLDGSPVYGSDKKIASQLRLKSGGKLKKEYRKGSTKGYLPSVEDKAAVCDLRNLSEPCYLAGDRRINQNPTLAMLQTLLLREHNRVADILSNLNPFWSDEMIYQEARRIVVAVIQHITYQEWLPLNFGESYLRYYRITPSGLYSRDYNENVNPGVINSFGAGALRFLHTIVPDTIMMCPGNYKTTHLHKLSENFFNPSLLESTPQAFDDIVRGALAHSASSADPYMSGELTNLLFKSTGQWGLDLTAMDIQRGRDHGLASYNDYREVCGLRRAKTFKDLAGEINQDRINTLAYLYESVDDIDLIVGGAMEREVPGSIFGHTFHSIIAEQFYRTRIGDRFFYDHGEMAHSFTPDQLKELKKASMARLICDNTEAVDYVQRKAFELETSSNPKYRCDEYDAIPYVDLTAWKTPESDLLD
ncbi:hypothetical protein K1T71_006516 [Dendrolimus kikuchii]|uniref:Uncharacterized protein n=1 Tax=Dendrolimus kikuchii TaxID=765133 RepID=A0ACC1D246_9NEOP|nr:hypothetical protein K1T71_006516 [Dendrolimus kikuchii]